MPLTFREHAWSEPVQLDVEARDVLTRLVPDLSLRPVTGTADVYRVRPGSSVGVVILGETQILIRPKIGFDRTLFLASYSPRMTDLTALEASLAADDEVVEAAALAFARHCGVALRRGALRAYRTIDDVLPAVRGRLRFEGTVRRFGLVPPIDVTYDEYTEDIDENRLLRAALSALRRIGVRRTATRRILGSHEMVLGDVPAVHYDPHRLPVISFTRLNEHYRPAIELARRIVTATSFELRSGEVRASAFLFDMNRVFEDFVVTALRDALGLDETRLPQGRVVPLDRAGRVRMQPDISWWRGRRCAFVGDAKYKRTEIGEHADLYQLLAYVTAAGLREGLLVYAAGEAQPGVHEVRHSGVRLHVRTLDIAGPPATILAEVADLAAHVRSIVPKPAPAGAAA